MLDIYKQHLFNIIIVGLIISLIVVFHNEIIKLEENIVRVTTSMKLTWPDVYRWQPIFMHWMDES
jgi:hypothetical protein